MTAPEVEFGVITEQGDLGLGFNPLNESDNTVVAKAEEKKSSRKKKIAEEKAE